MQKTTIFWFRRDLRLDDNHGFFEALKSENPVLPLFIFDKEILDELPEDDHRVSLIHKTLSQMNEKLKEKGGSLYVKHGKPLEVFKELSKEFDIQGIYTNHDYEPYAKTRDKEIADFAQEHDIDFQTFKDQVIFEKNEVLKDDGDPYLVYTPYMKSWREKFDPEKDLTNFASEDELENCIKNKEHPWLSLSDIGFQQSDIEAPEFQLDQELLRKYKETRDFPAKDGTSYLSTYLRFGLVSIRRIMEQANKASQQTFMNELIWREFFMMILWHFPYSTDRAFREQYDYIQWRNDEEEFEKWKKGETGYPMVDAGMRELNATGYMHNRVRMVVGSFLCKHLLIDWRWGERYFAEKLFDYELSSNVGNWQWVAGTGVDAAPYFRIFNPHTQFEKFDPDGSYVKKWVPEYFGVGYVSEMVDHKEARERCLEVYKQATEDYKKR